MHVISDETNPMKMKKIIDIDDGIKEMTMEDEKPKEDNASTPQEDQEKKEDKDQEDEPEEMPKSWRFVKHYPQNLIFGDPSQGVKTKRNINAFCEHHAFISQIEPKTIEEALEDENWVLEMQEELNQFKRKIWRIVDRPSV